MVRCYVLRSTVTSHLVGIPYNGKEVIAAFLSKEEAARYLPGYEWLLSIDLLTFTPTDREIGLVVKIGHSWRAVGIVELSKE